MRAIAGSLAEHVRDGPGQLTARAQRHNGVARFDRSRERRSGYQWCVVDPRVKGDAAAGREPQGRAVDGEQCRAFAKACGRFDERPAPLLFALERAKAPYGLIEIAGSFAARLVI